MCTHMDRTLADVYKPWYNEHGVTEKLQKSGYQWLLKLTNGHVTAYEKHSARRKKKYANPTMHYAQGIHIKDMNKKKK